MTTSCLVASPAPLSSSYKQPGKPSAKLPAQPSLFHRSKTTTVRAVWFACSFIVSITLLSPAAHAQASHSPLRITNPGFEEELAGWSVLSGWRAPKGVPLEAPSALITSEQARSGSNSVRLQSIVTEKGRSRPMVEQTIRHVEPNSIYYLTAWAKGGKGGKGSIRAAIKLEFYNANGHTHGVNGYHSLRENGEWDRLQVVARSRGDTTHLKVYARNMEPGATVYFDDVSIAQPHLIMLEPTRLVHFPGRTTPVTVNIWTSKPLAKGASVDLIASHQGKETRFRSEVKEVDAQTYEVSAELPAITEGHYTLTVAIGDERSPVTARTFASVEQRKPENLTDTGTILHNGKPFFPIGIYHPQNWTYYRLGATRNDVEGVKDDYARLAAMGFNAVQGSSTRDLEMFGRYLDEAWRHGLVVDVPFYAGNQVRKNLQNSLEKMSRYKDHPAILNWKISDEPDMRPAIVEEVPEAYFTFKKADARTPIEVTLATDHALKTWSSFADIIQINRYPLPGGELTAVSDYTRLAVENKQPWQNISYVVQSGWTKPGTVPTPEELRSMIYLALIEGAKGIWYYTMYDPDFDLSKEEIWPHLKEINAEVAELSVPVMLGEYDASIRVDNPKVYTRALEHEGKLYVLITNPERTSQKGILSLPARWARAGASTLNGEAVEVANFGRIPVALEAIESRTLVFNLDNDDE